MQKNIAVILLVFIMGCSWASQMSYKGRVYFGLTEENIVSNDISSLKGAGIVIGRVVRENTTGGFADYIDRSTMTMLHASDLVENAERELKIWFKESEICNNYETGVEKIFYDAEWSKGK